MGAPRDGTFYAELDKMAQRVGAKSEDLLLVWSSESGLRSDLAGDSRTFSTLMKYIAVPGVMDQATWDKLPTMTHAEQLPYVEKGIYAPARRMLGRGYKTTFEVYLSNAAPGLLRPDGTYSEATVMYAGSNYPDNWAMDNAPAGVQRAAKDGVKLSSLRDTYPYAQQLVNEGVLKGYVSLGDLKNFAKRVLTGGGVFQDALVYLGNVRQCVAVGTAPNVDGPPPDFLLQAPVQHASFTTSKYTPAQSYTPDFDDAFPSGAPRDDRVATPDQAKKKLPKRAPTGEVRGFTIDKAIGPGALIGGLVALGVGIVYLVGAKK